MILLNMDDIYNILPDSDVFQDQTTIKVIKGKTGSDYRDHRQFR